jgi:hypothetical protein
MNDKGNYLKNYPLIGSWSKQNIYVYRTFNHAGTCSLVSKELSAIVPIRNITAVAGSPKIHTHRNQILTVGT